MVLTTARRSNNSFFLKNRFRAMWACIAFSLLLHAFLIIAIHKTVPMDWSVRPLKTYHVEFVRPPVEPGDYDGEMSSEPVEADPRKEGKAPARSDTITLDTKDKRYRSYAFAVKERLQASWEYPAGAKKDLLEGDVLIMFSLASDGSLKGIRVLKSSGRHILDRGATSAIESAAPFPGFPRSLPLDRLNIKASFSYRIGTAK